MAGRRARFWRNRPRRKPPNRSQRRNPRPADNERRADAAKEHQAVIEVEYQQLLLAHENDIGPAIKGLAPERQAFEPEYGQLINRSRPARESLAGLISPRPRTRTATRHLDIDTNGGLVIGRCSLLRIPRSSGKWPVAGGVTA